MQSNQDAMDSKVNDLLSVFKSASSGAGSGAGKCLPDAVLAEAYLFAARVVIREV